MSSFLLCNDSILPAVVLSDPLAVCFTLPPSVGQHLTHCSLRWLLRMIVTVTHFDVLMVLIRLSVLPAAGSCWRSVLVSIPHKKSLSLLSDPQAIFTGSGLILGLGF